MSLFAGGKLVIATPSSIKTCCNWHQLHCIPSYESTYNYPLHFVVLVYEVMIITGGLSGLCKAIIKEKRNYDTRYWHRYYRNRYQRIPTQ